MGGHSKAHRVKAQHRIDVETVGGPKRDRFTRPSAAADHSRARRTSPRIEPGSSPFPDIAGQIADAIRTITGRGVGAGRLGFAVAHAEIGALGIWQLVPPGIKAAVTPTRGLFPFLFRRKPQAGPFTVCLGVEPADAHDRVVKPVVDAAARAFWPPPISLFYFDPTAAKPYARETGVFGRRPILRRFYEPSKLSVGHRYAPGFFAWIIPLGGDRFRIGWGMSGMADHGGHLENLIADYPDVFRDIEILTQTGGLIPVGPRPLTAGDHGMVVGDAAGQAKPTSGGGLYTSLTCAAHCAETAITALTRGDTTGATLSAYDRSWRADIGQELMRSVALRRAYRELTDDELEWGLRLLRIPGMVRLVNRYGDIDYPSRLATVALRAAPALLRLLHGRPELFRTLQEPAIPYDGWSDVDALGDPIITSGWPPIGNQEPGLAGNLD